MYSAYLTVFMQSQGEYGYTPAAGAVRNLLTKKPEKSFPRCVLDVSTPKTGLEPWFVPVSSPDFGNAIWVSVGSGVVLMPRGEDEELNCYRDMTKVSTETQFGIKPPKGRVKFHFNDQAQAGIVMNNLPDPLSFDDS
jgi:hypothetical protein